MKSASENQYYSFNTNQVTSVGSYSYPPSQYHQPYDDPSGLFGANSIYNPTVTGQDLLNNAHHHQQQQQIQQPTSDIGYNEQYISMNKFAVTEISAENEAMAKPATGKKSRKNKSKIYIIKRQIAISVCLNYFTYK